MFDNIVANNEINFNELEQKIYKFVCEELQFSKK